MIPEKSALPFNSREVPYKRTSETQSKAKIPLTKSKEEITKKIIQVKKGTDSIPLPAEPPPTPPRRLSKQIAKSPTHLAFLQSLSLQENKTKLPSTPPKPLPKVPKLMEKFLPSSPKDEDTVKASDEVADAPIQESIPPPTPQRKAQLERRARHKAIQLKDLSQLNFTEDPIATTGVSKAIIKKEPFNHGEWNHLKEIEDIIFSNAEKKEEDKISQEEFAALFNLYLAPEQLINDVKIIVESILISKPIDNEKIDACVEFLMRCLTTPYLVNNFKENSLKIKLDEIFNKLSEYNSSKYSLINSKYQKIINETIKEDKEKEIPVAHEFNTFNELLYLQKMNKNDRNKRIEFIAKEFKQLFINDCEGMSIKDVYEYLNVKDKDNQLLKANKCAKFNQLSDSISNQVTKSIIDQGNNNFEKSIDFYLDLTNKALEGRDYATAFSLYTGLKNFDSKISEYKNCKKRFEKLENLFNVLNNYPNLRKEIESNISHCIVPAQVFMKDMFMINDTTKLFNEEGNIKPSTIHILYKKGQVYLNAIPRQSASLNSNLEELLNLKLPGDQLSKVAYTVKNPKNFARDTAQLAKKINSDLDHLESTLHIENIKEEINLLSKLCEHWSPHSRDQSQYQVSNLQKCANLLDEAKDIKKGSEIKTFITDFLNENFINLP